MCNINGVGTIMIVCSQNKSQPSALISGGVVGKGNGGDEGVLRQAISRASKRIGRRAGAEAETRVGAQPRQEKTALYLSDTLQIRRSLENTSSDIYLPIVSAT